MATQTRRSNPEDPLEGYSGLALFPRTFASVANPPKPYHPDDLHHVHNFLKSMPLRSPNKLLEEAKAIVDGGSGISNSEMQRNVTSRDANEVIAEKVNEKPRERRPALGRKRARFSMKPQYSQPTVSLERSLDFGKLKDPEEFFAAFEKLENARREIEKQTGVVLTESNHQNFSMAPRPRRPGMLGRRPAKYKHLYSNENSSQETLEENILSPSYSNVQLDATNTDVPSQEREDNYAELQENELDLIARSEKRVNNLLDELLAANDEDLDSDGAINILQEHLQIKPIDLDKLCLPDLQNVRRIDLTVSGASSNKPRNPLSDIQNFLQGMGSKTSNKRKLSESYVPCLASPTPLKSPLGSIISLKKHILQSNPLNDPFSALDVGQLPEENASAFGSTKIQTEEVNKEKGSSISLNLKSPMIEENVTAVVNTSLPEADIEENSVPCLPSPTSPKSPPASTISLKEHIVQLNPLNDPCSALNVDQLPARNSSPLGSIEVQTEVNVEKGRSIFPNLKSPMIEENGTAVLNTSFPEVDIEESSAPCLPSPTSPKSPPGSSFKKHILQSNPLNDPSSTLNVDQLPVRNAPPIGSIEKQTEEVNREKGWSISSNLKFSMIKEIDTAVVDASLPEVDVEDVTCSNTSLPEVAVDVTCSSDKTANDNLSRLSSGIGVGSSGFHDDVEGSIGGSCMDNMVASETLCRPGADTDVHPIEPAAFDDKAEDVLPEALDYVQPDLNMEDSTGGILNDTHKMQDVLREVLDHVQPILNNEDSTAEKLNNMQSQLDQTSHDGLEDHAMDEPSKTVETGPQQHNEELQVSTSEPVNEQRKASSHPHKKGKREEALRRQSLAASGTSWESGVRRSTRIRSRPLEYWRGERFLYGRVHASLPTVIGIKYESPGNADGKLGLKVKSFVSDKYQDLVELAARF